MVVKRDFVEDANAKHGEKIRDAEILQTQNGETRKTIIGINPSGKEAQIIEADSQPQLK